MNLRRLFGVGELGLHLEFEVRVDVEFSVTDFKHLVGATSNLVTADDRSDGCVDVLLEVFKDNDFP